MQSNPNLDFSILSSLLPAEIRGHIRRKDIAMKKLALLSAVMTLGISSWAFAADNPPPPPEKGAQHQGKPLAKTANTMVSKRNTTASSHNEMANSRSMMANSRSMVASSRSVTASSHQKAASTAGNRCRQKHNPSGLAFCARLFFTFFQLTLTNSCPSLRSREKNLHNAWHSKPTPLIRRVKVC